MAVASKEAQMTRNRTLTETLGKGEREERVYVASQWQLMRWRFRKHRLAMLGAIALCMAYAAATFSEFCAPYDPQRYDPKLLYMPPQLIRIVDRGRLSAPFVYGIVQQVDPVSFRRTYMLDTDVKHKVRLFARGDPYRMWGLIPGDVHLIGTEAGEGPLHLLGTDRMGRDMLSRIIAGSRVSLSIGMVGVFASLVLGILVGGFTGYYGGIVDALAQRGIEFLRTVPPVPLLMALSAAVPTDWSPIRVYFGITLIIATVSWTDMARIVRSKFLSMREEEFVLAARLSGTSEARVVLRHMVPSFLSHIIASVTLAIPSMILGETSLSFIGVGLRAPTVSWGVILQDAQQLSAVALSPWLLAPGLAIVLAVLSFNFLGDGLRDAADPYAR